MKPKPKPKQEEQSSPLVPQLATGAGGAMIGHGLYKALNPGNEVGFTYGTQPWMGSGHRAPGEALAEVLKRDPRFSKYKLTQMPMPTGETPLAYKRPLLATVDTGFGAQTKAPTLNFLTDLPYSAEQLRDLQTFRHSGNAGRGVVYYGPEGAIPTHMGEPGTPGVARSAPTYHIGNVSPALHPDVRESITGSTTSRQLTPLDRNSYEKMLTSLTDRTGQPIGINRAALKGKKIIAISGSGRGDYVGERARQLAEHLKSIGRDDVVVLAAGAGGADEAAKITKGLDNVITLPSLNQKDFVNVLRGADLHYGSSGASSVAESLASGNRFVLPKSWTEFETQTANPIRKRLGLPELSTDPKNYTSKSWLDRVNAGALRYAKERGVPMVDVAQPQHVIDILDSAEAGHHALGRGQAYLRELDLSQARFKDFMHSFLNRAQWANRGKGLALAAAGAPLAYLGARALWNRHRKPEMRKQSAEQESEVKPIVADVGAAGLAAAPLVADWNPNSIYGGAQTVVHKLKGVEHEPAMLLKLRNVLTHPKNRVALGLGLGGAALTAYGLSGGEKRGSFATGLGLRVGESLLAPAVRRTGLLKNYYSALARTGFQHGMEGTQLAPKLRPLVGAISPSLSGLTDYEMGRFLGSQALERGPQAAQALGHPPPAVARALDKMMGKGAPAANQLGIVPEYITNNSVKPTSPLLQHLQHGLQENPQSPVVEWMKRKFTSTAAPKPSALGMATMQALPEMALGALTQHPVEAAAGAVLGNLPENALVSRAYAGKPGMLSKLKANVFHAGMQQEQAPPSLWGRLKNWAFRASSPASNELFQAGQDAQRYMTQAQRTAGVTSEVAAAPVASQAAAQERNLRTLQQRVGQHLSQHANMPYSQALAQ